MKIIIIGAGIAGLAASIRLRVLGFEVVVYEANSYPGGKLTAFKLDGFRFDAGPSLFTMPHLVDDLFRYAGKTPGDYFRYQRLDTLCEYFYPDGTLLTAYADPQRFAKEAKEKTGESEASLLAYLKHSKHIYESVGKIFLEKSLHKAGTWLDADVGRALLGLHKYGLLNTMDGVNRKKLNSPKLVQLFNRFATYNGSNPYRAPGILNTIPHLEHGMGAFSPKGGMHAITESLYGLASELGVGFHFGKKAEKIDCQNGKASGIIVGGKKIAADIVVCNSDIYPAYRDLLHDQRQPEKTLRQERSSSALIFYWGVKGAFAQLGLHNIFFSSDYKGEFRHLFEHKTVCDDPTVYVNITSKLHQQDAPKGMENWFTMINVPANTGQDWDQVIERSKKRVIAKLSSILGVSLQPLIVCEEVLDPRSIELKTGSYQGSLYGTSSNSKLAAFLRHPNFSSQVNNLYFCGGSVHPGGGIPLCLLSGQIVADLVREKHANTHKKPTH